MLKQNLNQKQLQKLSPQQIQFIQLLQLNTAEFEKRIDEELTENPALEDEKQEATPEETQNEFDTEIEKETSDTDSEGEDESPEIIEDETESIESDFEESLSDYLVDDDEPDYNYSLPTDPNEEKRDIPLASTSTLYDSLQEQLLATGLNEREKELAKHLIGMVEEDGYMRRPLKSVAYDMAFLSNIKTDEDELEKILEIIQSFDPAGIGARDLEECLLLQLERKNQKDEKVKLATKIVKTSMDDLAKKHYEKMMRSLKVDRDTLKDAIDLITHLDPRPGDSQVSFKTQYIIPDFTVTFNENELQVSLNSRNAPEMRVNKNYQETMKAYQESDKKDKNLKGQVQFIKQKIDGAKWFIDAIRQRQNTLLYTMKTIVEYQKDFFMTGDIEQLQPMILKDIADRIGMDISTVSRVANSKYVQTDFGIYSLKEFFSEGITTDSGEEVSNKEVKSILKTMIGAESKRKPVTDEKLTAMLNEKGYNIARRTVAKYREQLNIPVARLRKEI